MRGFRTFLVWILAAALRRGQSTRITNASSIWTSSGPAEMETSRLEAPGAVNRPTTATARAQQIHRHVARTDSRRNGTQSSQHFLSDKVAAIAGGATSVLQGSESLRSTTTRRLAQCDYHPPDQVPTSQGYKGMSSLNDPEWTATRGEADGKHVLFFAYGRLFQGYGQIGAWKYNDQTNFVEYWYSKSHCPGMCSDCCDGGGGNIPGFASKSLNPSADQGTFTVTYKLVNKFYEDDMISFGSFGTFRLKNVNGKWRVERRPGFYVAHVYTCSKSSFALKYRDADDKIVQDDSELQDNPCFAEDEEFYGGRCYKSCKALTDGIYVIRQSANVCKRKGCGPTEESYKSKNYNTKRCYKRCSVFNSEYPKRVSSHVCSTDTWPSMFAKTIRNGDSGLCNGFGVSGLGGNNCPEPEDATSTQGQGACEGYAIASNGTCPYAPAAAWRCGAASLSWIAVMIASVHSGLTS
eukprot:TRINITY_DN91879_c0_g1_i1.p1 TRINITY_DN91879_c0_g1~~TRINITY_DN91879_c0_g1_i1.p1  ORF type:complete len:465 (-),score=44.18 TRINITY_DN91879_c0_g1_i1:43-1437(-)